MKGLVEEFKDGDGADEQQAAVSNEGLEELEAAGVTVIRREG